MEKKTKQKNIKTSVGTSTNKDPHKAAVEAASKALKKCKNPSFSIVYTNDQYDQKQFLAGVNEVLGTNWVGISTDKIFTGETGFDPNLSIAVLCIESAYMHFSVSVADKYRKNPKKKAFNAAKEAVEKIESDKYVDAYIQFNRTKKKNYGNIIRNPPYFMLTFISGVKAKNGKVTPGQEVEFVSGLLEYTGPNIPVFGGSASSSLEEYFNEKADNWQFANGKMYKGAAIVVFVVCNLHFSTLVSHGYTLSKDYAIVTKLDKTGYEILELNNKEPVAEYARLLGITKKQYLKESDKVSYSRPFGMIQHDGTAYIKEAIPNPDNKTLHSTFKIHQNSILNILQLDKKKSAQTTKDAVNVIVKQKSNRKPALALFCSCSGRRPVIKGIEKKDFSNLKKANPKLEIFGFYSFGEVGSTRNNSAQSHSQTVTSLVIFSDLLTN
jgi:hypothetical protein